MNQSTAPGALGIAPTWSSSDKPLVGTDLGPARRWYTLDHGIRNQTYYPRIDMPQIRDLGFIIADDKGSWVDVKRLLPVAEVRLPAPGIPLPRILHRHPRFILTLRICPDPKRDALLLDGRPFDRLQWVWPRYGGERPDASTWVWTAGAPVTRLSAG